MNGSYLSPDKVVGFTFGYAGIYESYYSSGSNTVRLPHYRERYDNANSSTVAEWATLCSVVNATDSADTVTITAKDSSADERVEPNWTVRWNQ